MELSIWNVTKMVWISNKQRYRQPRKERSMQSTPKTIELAMFCQIYSLCSHLFLE